MSVHHGDCLEIISTLGRFDFIFADPPFNIGQEYNGFEDHMDVYEYRRFTRRWIVECWNALSREGVLCLHGPDDLVLSYLKTADMFDMHRVAWVNWHYRFGQCSRSNWIDSRCHCLIFARVKGAHAWNPEEVLVDSDRVAYGDKRVHETERGGKRLPFTVWGLPSDGVGWGRIQGNNAERRKGHPNQLPELYLERLIKAYTNLGGRVLDPFGGSGTTAVVAQALGREFETIDVSEANCQSIRERLEKGSVRCLK